MDVASTNRILKENREMRELIALQRALLTEWWKFGQSPGHTPLQVMHHKAADLTARSAPYVNVEVES